MNEGINKMKKFTLTTILFAAFAIIFQVFETKAAWGDYDPSFGFGGVAVDSVTGYYPQATALQPDGKILVTGYRTSVYGGNVFFLRRYLSNGSIDTAFGTNGEASGFDTIGLRSNYVGLNIAVLPNGKIAVAGKANGFYAVWQVSANGKNDKTFGQNGLLLLNQYPVNQYMSRQNPEINIQGGKILLTFPKVSAANEPIVLVRLNANGTLDQTFGNAGESVTDLLSKPFQTNQGFGTIIERNGKITVGGSKIGNGFVIGLDRKLADGNPDLTFLPVNGSGCCVTMPGLVRLDSGKYEMWTNNSGITFFVLEFNALGGYERNSFGGDLNTGGGYCPDIFTKQNDGKFLMSASRKFYRLDAEISNQNAETNRCENLQLISDFSRAVLTPDDRIVAAGRYNGSLILVRLLPN